MAVTFQVSVPRIVDIAQAMETTPDAIFSRDGFPLRGDGGLTLARVLPRFAEDLFQPSLAPLPPRVVNEVRRLIDEILCETIGRTVAQPASRRMFPDYHRVRLAEDMIRAQSDDAVSMLSIAEALGVSLRSLQLAFSEVHDGMNPREFLIRVRLEKARARLLAAQVDAKVTTIAMDCGFFHLGRFAQAYARLYRELPSETLARRRT
jgi:transcriptional regulator GlxA family with amidase domain